MARKERGLLPVQQTVSGLHDVFSVHCAGPSSGLW